MHRKISKLQDKLASLFQRIDGAHLIFDDILTYLDLLKHRTARLLWAES